MAHFPRYEAHLNAAWRDPIATLDALQVKLLAAPATRPPEETPPGDAPIS